MSVDTLVALRRRRAFTVLELVVALAIVAVLLALALPSYQRYALRAQRAEAVRQLLAAADCQERVRAGTGYYDPARCLPAAANGAYGFRFETADAAQSLAFTVHATPRRTRPGDRCGGLSLDQAGTRGITGSPEYLADCWGGR